jgi:hypothetical protein
VSRVSIYVAEFSTVLPHAVLLRTVYKEPRLIDLLISEKHAHGPWNPNAKVMNSRLGTATYLRAQRA